MLVDGRPDMVRRAIECFRAQTYQNRLLVVVDSGADATVIAGAVYHRDRSLKGAPIGLLRNEIMRHEVSQKCDIVIHFDSDDVSHPHRIEEQVAHLVESGADAVGYNTMLFWEERQVWTCCDTGMRSSGQAHDTQSTCSVRCTGGPPIPEPEAWLYHNPIPSYALGTSLCYWRKTWERVPFLETPTPTDQRAEYLPWIERGMVWNPKEVRFREEFRDLKWEPPMIARIHSGNSSPWYRRDLRLASERQAGEWRRAQQWDDYCRRRMT